MARGFDEYYGHTAGHWGEYFDPPLEHNGKPVREKGYIVDLCTNKALSFIERHKDGPFFCYVPFTTPHSPWAAPPENWAHFKDKPIPQQATDPKQEEINHTRCALAMLENQDWNVGRLLNKLEDLGLAANTIVFYFSDNGPNSWRWNDGMKGRKGSTDEGGIRSIAYMRWPKRLPKGRNVTQIAGAIDLLPTLTSMAGIERVGKRPLDGRDLSPLLLGSDGEWEDRLIFSTWGNKVSVRTQDYRLDQQGNLYDMRTDPGQTHPVNKDQQETAARLAKQVEEWREEVGRDDGSVGRIRGKGRGRSVDPRPFPVGYREFPRTWLPARDGEPQGGVKRSSGAPNCSYFVDWTSTRDTIEWNVDVHTSGEYDVVIDYTCPIEDAGSTIELSFGDSRLSGAVEPGWDPPLYTNQDTLPRPPAESQMKEFRPLRLGTIHLDAGEGALTLRATKIPGREVMDLRALTLTLKE
jgi:arylsulfatase A-like enzyme